MEHDAEVGDGFFDSEDDDAPVDMAVVYEAMKHVPLPDFDYAQRVVAATTTAPAELADVQSIEATVPKVWCEVLWELEFWDLHPRYSLFYSCCSMYTVGDFSFQLVAHKSIQLLVTILKFVQGGLMDVCMAKDVHKLLNVHIIFMDLRVGVHSDCAGVNLYFWSSFVPIIISSRCCCKFTAYSTG